MFTATVIFTLCFVAIAFAVACMDFPQLVAKKDLKTWDREKVGGGVGTLAGKFSFTRNDAPEEFAIKEIGWMTLLPGDSIGFHKHDNNEDTYIIVSGKGTFTDNEGRETEVFPGDVTIARAGQSHGLANTGAEPLVFLDLIAQK